MHVNQQLQVAIWKSQNGSGKFSCPWWCESCTCAAYMGHLNICNGSGPRIHLVHIVKTHAQQRQEGGHLDVLKWLKSQGSPCPSSHESTCAFEAEAGQPEVPKRLRDPDPPCPWSDVTCIHAADSGHLKILQWAPMHGCSRRVTIGWKADAHS